MTVPLPYHKDFIGRSYRDSNYLSSYSVNAVTAFVDKTGSGVKRAHWKKLPSPQKGEPLAYSMKVEGGSHPYRTTSHTEFGWNGLGYSNNYSYEGYPGTIDMVANMNASVNNSDSDYKALNKLLDQMKGEGANLANMLGERKQVVQSVENVLNTFVYTIRDLRRGNVTSAIRRMGGDPRTARKLRGTDIANQWLSLQYGWLPMMDDVYQLINQTHRRESSRFVVFKAGGRSAGSRRTLEYDTVYGSNLYYGMVDSSVKTGYMIRARPNLSIAEPAALGFTNPLGVLWEITPWSFVVDWFLPVGNYLDQLTADHGWTFLDGCKSVLRKADASMSASRSLNYYSGGWSYTNSYQIKGYRYYVDFGRAVLTNFPRPKLPQFKNPFSTGHLWNSIALLSQVVSGGPVSSHGRR